VKIKDMATEEDVKKAEPESADAEDEAAAQAGEDAPGPDALAKVDGDAEEAPAADAPVQLGYQRYVYAAYMAFAMLAGFLAAKIGHASWYRLGQWKPELGEPKDELIYPVAGAIGVIIAVYYWRKAEARQYANEVAEELSKVTWPTRKEVTNSTTVVVLTTLFATVFFALMDRFWGFITDKIYTF
jgi:preprotein translocase subunit SecE